MKKIIFQTTILMRKVFYYSFFLFNKFFFREKSKIIILCYHSIAYNDWRFTINLENFKKQIIYLKKIGYKFISLSELGDYVDGKKTITQPSVVINFDDGYKGLLEVEKFLKSLNIKPTLFILSDTDHPNREELGNYQKFLSIKEIKELQRAGWEIGCHSATHSNLSLLRGKKLEDEIINSKIILEKRLGIDIKFFSYPRGKYNELVLSLVKKAGYTLGVTMDDGVITTGIDLLRIPRIGIDATHTFTEFKSTISPMAIKIRNLIKSSSLNYYL